MNYRISCQDAGTSKKGRSFLSLRVCVRPCFQTVFAAVSLLALAGCTRNAGLPKPESKEYRDLVTAFYVGLAGLQTGEDVRAREKLMLATKLAPGEPAPWANLGLLGVRQQEFDAAYQDVEKARSLAPDNSQIETLLGLIESKRGKLPESIAHLTKAIELDPKNLKALYALAQETERQATETSDAEAQKLLERILGVEPGNLAVLLDLTRLAAKRGDVEGLKKTVTTLAQQSSDWPGEAKEQMAALQATASGDYPRAAATQSAFLKNVLARVPAYRRSVNDVKTPAEFVGDPFLKFIKLPSPGSQPAPPDTAISFSVEELASIDPDKASHPMVVAFDAETKPSLVFHDRREVNIADGAKIVFGDKNSAAWNVAAFDFNYDFKTDLVTVSDRGLRFFRQENIRSFTEVTEKTALPKRILGAKYGDLHTFDFELDGDLDILLCPNPVTTQPILLRNNGDGTFKELFPFGGLKDIRYFATADIDGDGDPDLAIVDATGFRILINERLGQYREQPAPSNLGSIISIAVGDLNADGVIDLVLINRDGQILRLSDKGSAADWDVSELTRIKIDPMVSDAGSVDTPGAGAALLLADLDNNGSLDIVADERVILLSDAQGKLTQVSLPDRVRVRAISDLNNDGRLDLIGRRGDGKAVQLINHGSRGYHSQTIRTRAAQATGDQRINSFGIGGEIEIRSGLLTQKQVITSPLLHFGLGENRQTDVARIVWPNGAVQAEFELKADQSILAEQRLKGSCPALFAWDGKQMGFVKDCSPWNPALGLRINAQVVANVEQTEEWFRIRGDQLAPRDGFYDLRVTGELWEVFYIDHYSLMIVDHPPGTEVLTDERFTTPQPKPRLYLATTPRPFAGASDDRGQDVSAIVGRLDQEYLDTFGRGQYQGVTRDHWVELEMGDDAPRDRPLLLIGHGWVHPTDATINVAIGQNSSPPPQGLTLEVPDRTGRWVTAKSGLGFLSGKLKTMVVELDGVFRPGAPRKLRLRTNMEIYWDKLEWAEPAALQNAKVTRLDAASAELRYRGFSKFTQANASSPELPDYNRLEGTQPRWRDLTGYYTRYGDVSELLIRTDDRMLIMNAGDELRLRFKAPADLPVGWKRDFVMVGDGWTKDGDYNCTYAATVLPLPFHGIKDYNQASTKLEDNPAYKRYPRDWQEYHTRYVTPERFQRALMERE